MQTLQNLLRLADSAMFFWLKIRRIKSCTSTPNYAILFVSGLPPALLKAMLWTRLIKFIPLKGVKLSCDDSKVTVTSFSLPARNEYRVQVFCLNLPIVLFDMSITFLNSSWTELVEVEVDVKADVEVDVGVEVEAEEHSRKC